MTVFIRLTRLGPPEREVLINLEHVMLAQDNQQGGTSILFGKEHVINFVETYDAVLNTIANGPYVRTDHA